MTQSHSSANHSWIDPLSAFILRSSFSHWSSWSTNLISLCISLSQSQGDTAVSFSISTSSQIGSLTSSANKPACLIGRNARAPRSACFSQMRVLISSRILLYFNASWRIEESQHFNAVQIWFDKFLSTRSRVGHGKLIEDANSPFRTLQYDRSNLSYSNLQSHNYCRIYAFNALAFMRSHRNLLFINFCRLS